jgi:proline dehydrogenase
MAHEVRRSCSKKELERSCRKRGWIMEGISTQTLQQSLGIYYQRLTNWNTTEEKRQKYLKRIEEITEELGKRESA